MTILVDVKEDNREDFLQILQSLKNTGVIEFFQRTNQTDDSLKSLNTDETPLSEDELIEILARRSEDVKNGNYLPHDEAVKFMQAWRRIKRKSTGRSEHS